MENININEWERIDDLQLKGLKIIQNKTGFCFGMDAVLLSSFADLKKDEKVVDLGTGTGILPILLAGKTKVKIIYGVEIQKDVAEMADRSIGLNNLRNKVKIINGDIKNCYKILGRGNWDAVVTNPPYLINNSGLKNVENKKAISRHEIKCTLDDVLNTSNKLLKVGGKFYMVHRPDRLTDIIYNMRVHKIEPKIIRLVYPNVNKPSNLILIKGIRNSRPGMKMIKPLYVYNEDGSYTEEIYSIYGMSGDKK